MEEEWFDIKNFDGLYQVSKKGNIRSLDRKVKHNYGGYAIKKGKILKQERTKEGYARVTLVKNNKKYRFSTHRIVAETFCNKRKSTHIVNHKDGVKDNNESSNLEWVSYSENRIHAINSGLVDIEKNKEAVKKANSKPILLKKETKKIEFSSQTKASVFLGVSIQVLSYALKNNTKCCGWYVERM